MENHRIKYDIYEDRIKQHLSNLSVANNNKRRILNVKGKFSFANNKQVKSSLLSLIQRQLAILGELESLINEVLNEIVQAKATVGGDKRLTGVKDNSIKILEEIRQYEVQLKKQIAAVS